MTLLSTWSPGLGGILRSAWSGEGEVAVEEDAALDALALAFSIIQQSTSRNTYIINQRPCHHINQ